MMDKQYIDQKPQPSGHKKTSAHADQNLNTAQRRSCVIAGYGLSSILLGCYWQWLYQTAFANDILSSQDVSLCLDTLAEENISTLSSRTDVELLLTQMTYDFIAQSFFSNISQLTGILTTDHQLQAVTHDIYHSEVLEKVADGELIVDAAKYSNPSYQADMLQQPLQQSDFNSAKMLPVASDNLLNDKQHGNTDNASTDVGQSDSKPWMVPVLLLVGGGAITAGVITSNDVVTSIAENQASDYMDRNMDKLRENAKLEIAQLIADLENDKEDSRAYGEDTKKQETFMERELFSKLMNIYYDEYSKEKISKEILNVAQLSSDEELTERFKKILFEVMDNDKYSHLADSDGDIQEIIDIDDLF